MIDNALALFAMSPPSGEGGGPNLIGMLALWIPIFLVFYFLLIAPARKKQKKHGEMLAALKNGDKVITNGGLHGTVVGVTDQIVQVRIADKIKVDVSRNAIAGLLMPEQD